MAKWDHDDLRNQAPTYAHSPGYQQGSPGGITLVDSIPGIIPGTFVSAKKVSSLQTQVGGTHYTDMAIQPIEYILANNIPFPEGNVIKYVSRWRNKGGIKDLRKSIHHLELIIEHEEGKGTL